MKKGDGPHADEATLRRRAEAVVRRKAIPFPETDAAITAEEARRALHELRLHQVELELQNEDLRLAVVKLEDLRARYFDLYELAPVGYVTVSEKGLIQEANLGAASLLGAARNELIKKPLALFVLPGDQETYYKYLRLLIQTERPQVLELRIVPSGGAPRWVRLDSTAARGDEGASLGLISLIDIDAQRRAAEEAELSAQIGRLIGSTLDIDEIYERLAAEVRRLFPCDRLYVGLNNPDGETFTVAYASGPVIAGSRTGSVAPLAGSIAETVCRTRAGLIFHPASEAEMVRRFPGTANAAAFRAGMRSIMAVPLVSRNEAIGVLHFQARKSGAYAERDLSLAERIGMQVAGAIANARFHCALRERQEAALNESGALLQSILESTADGILAVNRNGGVLFANRRFAAMWRIPEEVLAVQQDSALLRCVLDQLSDPRAFLQQVRDRYQSDQEAFDEIHFKDGRVFERLSNPLLLGLGKTNGGRVWSFRDITPRRRMEEALRQAEANFHRSLDESPLGVRIATIDGDTLYANRALLDIYGYDSVDELRAIPVKKRYTPDSYEEFKMRLGKRLRGDRAPGPGEYEVGILRKDGEVRRLLAFRRSVLWNGREEFQILYYDVTDRRRMEEDIRKREEELAAESRRLAETNTALRVVLQRQEEDIREMEEKIVDNVKKLVLPYLDELRKLLPQARQLNYLDIVESNLQQIVSPFLRMVTAYFSDLTPRELQVAHLIRDGKSTKEIADILAISESAVDFHRNNIRRKLGLAKKSQSLHSFLQTLSE